MARISEFVWTLLIAYGIAAGILLLLFPFAVRGSKIAEKTKKDLGEVACGALMLLLGIGFLSSARSALLYDTPIFFKGWMYPWQAIIGGILATGFGLFLVIDGLRRKKKAPDER